ncbi:SET domain-containing protein 5 [Pseudocercospora fuligena]|uniref:SET domain-containing protein 5 n=1 Tax=Pseudocercospora fuligena TaxID=685502 RepID=A0A8H6VN28_9PEZI|nr:SET domain-containing protein 5 [Pseudocercospora fuligena]
MHSNQQHPRSISHKQTSDPLANFEFKRLLLQNISATRMHFATSFIGSTDMATTALGHIYFFINDGGEAAQDPKMPSNSIDAGLKVSTAPVQSTSTPSAGPSSTSDSSKEYLISAPGTASTHSSPLTPTAPAFEPSGFNPSAKTFVPEAPKVIPARTKNVPPYEMRLSPGKGYGLFATRHIPVGTRILCEKLLLAVDPSDLTNVHRKYLKLTAEERVVYDSLSCFHPSHIDFEQAANVYVAMSPRYHGLSNEATETLKGEITKVMGIFSANNFILAGGNQGVFARASRINHSCVPNVHHTNNPNIRRETVHAMRDIEAGEELLANYLGAGATYDPRFTRMEALRNNHGFICQCQACMDPRSDERRHSISVIFWGLNAYIEHSTQDHPYIPQTPFAALAQAEHGIGLMMEEGIFNTELYKAYRVAAMAALDLEDYAKAMEYAQNELEIEKNIIGIEVNDLVQLGVAAKLWVEKVREMSPKAAPAKSKKPQNKQKRLARKAKAEAKRAAAAPSEDE